MPCNQSCFIFWLIIARSRRWRINTHGVTLFNFPTVWAPTILYAHHRLPFPLCILHLNGWSSFLLQCVEIETDGLPLPLSCIYMAILSLILYPCPFVSSPLLHDANVSTSLPELSPYQTSGHSHWRCTSMDTRAWCVVAIHGHICPALPQ